MHKTQNLNALTSHKFLLIQFPSILIPLLWLGGHFIALKEGADAPYVLFTGHILISSPSNNNWFWFQYWFLSWNHIEPGIYAEQEKWAWSDAVRRRSSVQVWNKNCIVFSQRWFVSGKSCNLYHLLSYIVKSKSQMILIAWCINWSRNKDFYKKLQYVFCIVSFALSARRWFIWMFCLGSH